MNQSIRNCTCEFIGTFALTFIGAGAIITTAWTGGDPGLIGIALAHGLVLSVAVTATMNISGGHINPAVTIAMMVTGRIKPVAGLQYIVSQCAGAAFAGLGLLVVFGGLGTGAAGITGADAVTQVALGTPAFDAATITPAMAMVVEIFLTFLLVFAIFGTAVDGRAPNVGGFGIGLAVMVNILMAGPITGAAMNPARTLGPLLVGGDATAALWPQHWVYWLGPIIGAVGSAVLYDWLILKPGKEK